MGSLDLYVVGFFQVLLDLLQDLKTEGRTDEIGSLLLFQFLNEFSRSFCIVSLSCLSARGCNMECHFFSSIFFQFLFFFGFQSASSGIEYCALTTKCSCFTFNLHAKRVVYCEKFSNLALI